MCFREPDLCGSLRCYLGCLDVFKTPTRLKEHLSASVTSGGHGMLDIVIETVLQEDHPETTASSMLPDPDVLGSQRTQLMVPPLHSNELTAASSILPNLGALSEAAEQTQLMVGPAVLLSIKSNQSSPPCESPLFTPLSSEGDSPSLSALQPHAPEPSIPIEHLSERLVQLQLSQAAQAGMQKLSEGYEGDVCDGSPESKKGKKMEMDHNRDIEKWEKEGFREFGPKPWQIKEAEIDVDTGNPDYDNQKPSFSSAPQQTQASESAKTIPELPVQRRSSRQKKAVRTVQLDDSDYISEDDEGNASSPEWGSQAEDNGCSDKYGLIGIAPYMEQVGLDVIQPKCLKNSLKPLLLICTREACCKGISNVNHVTKPETAYGHGHKLDKTVQNLLEDWQKKFSCYLIANNSDQVSRPLNRPAPFTGLKIYDGFKCTGCHYACREEKTMSRRTLKWTTKMMRKTTTLISSLNRTMKMVRKERLKRKLKRTKTTMKIEAARKGRKGNAFLFKFN